MTGRRLRIASWVLLALTVGDVVLRQLTRLSLAEWFGGPTWPVTWTVTATLTSAAVLIALGAKRTRAVALFLALVALGSVWQVRLGARLQSDGFYYYAYARSIWFDHDVDLTNDYRLLGLDDAQHRHLFTPTVTGHAQTTWAIGPALLWSPFIGVGHMAAMMRHRTDPAISVDGTSFPYRQAVCLAGLCYGLLGFFLCYRIARHAFPPRMSTAAVVAVGAGSFMLWYLVREPTMSHTVSMFAVAAVVYGWLRVSPASSVRHWALLGLAGGLMTAVRWQNAAVLLLPLATLAVGWRSARADRALTVRLAAVFGAGVFVGFLPQMLAWQAIYGQPIAQSPIAPLMFWTQPQVADLLWSTRNGLFATSPAIYVATIGLVLLWRFDRRLSLAGLLVFALMVWTNGAVEDWYGGAGFGGRRFDSVVPFFVCGMAAFGMWLTRAVRRHPVAAALTPLLLLVSWNVLLMGVARGGAYRIGQPVSFGDIAASQAALVHDAIGHPPSYPANLLYALRNEVAPARFDLLRPGRFLGDPTRQYGRVDIGPGDDVYVAGGWHQPERAGDVGFRWAPAEVDVLIPLDHAADLTVQIRLQPFTYAGATPQRLLVFVNGRPIGPDAVALADDWHVVELDTPATAWRAGVNRVRLVFARETRPSEVGGADGRLLSAAVDYVRVVVKSAGSN